MHDKNRPARRGVATRRFEWLNVAGTIMLMVLLDVVGLTTATAHASQDIFLRLYSLVYDLDWSTSSSWPFLSLVPDGRNAPITIVLIDDATVKANGKAYPLPIETLRQLVSFVQCAKPKAIFVDLLLTRGPSADDDQQFQDFVEQLRKTPGGGEPKRDEDCVGAAPIIVGDRLDQARYPSPAEGALPRQLRDAALRVPINWDAPDGDYPLVIEPTKRWLADGWAYSTADGAKGVFSPAVELWLATADPPLDDAARRTNDNLRQTKAVHWFGKAMTIRWGYCPPERPAGYESPNGNSGSCDRCQRYGRLTLAIHTLLLDLSGFYASWHGTAAADARMPCLFHPTVSAGKVLRANYGTADEGSPMNAILRNRIVLIGAGLTGLEDFHISPVHGSIAGVYLHAMALDDLWRSDGAPLEEPGELLGFDMGALLPVFTTLLSYAVIRIRDRVDEHYHGCPPYLGKKNTFRIYWVIFTITLTAFLFFVLHWPPVNWIGILIGSSFVDAFKTWQKAASN